jgi:AraC-like DNA-binding protein
MRTRDLDEGIDAVARMFCPHTVEVVGRANDLNVTLDVKHPTTQPLVELSYAAPVRITSNFSRFLIMHCALGSASILQGGRTAEWCRGQTVPFSAGFETELRFDQHVQQKIVKVDTEKLEALCARWIGRPLDQPFRFALRPFSEELEHTWQRTLAFLHATDGHRLALSPAAKAAFDEFVLTMLLQQHPHNFSEELAEPGPTPAPALVRRAERFMADNAESAITVSDVADHLGVSVRSLQLGFRSWRNATPNAFLREIRLHRVREALLCAETQTSVTTVALRYGFSNLGRFSAYYQATFGEAPSATLRRGRSRS